MTIETSVGMADLELVEDTGARGSYVDWPAIIAGIVLASAISLVLLSFGSAIGLGFTNFHARAGASIWAIAIAAASWLIWVQVSSFMAGAYLTGRMRRRFADASEHESDVRDGAHGLLVWAGAAVLGAVLVVGGLGSAANMIGAAAGSVTEAAPNLAGDADDYFVDSLFRPAVPGTLSATGDQTQSRLEAGRILVRAVGADELSGEDRTYLASVVAANTGLSQAEAETRVDQIYANLETAKAQAADAAETARKTTIIGAFLMAASFMISAAAAYWAASMGGRHRDEGRVFSGFFRRY